MTYDITVITSDPQTVAVVTEQVAHDAIGPFLGRAFGEILAAVGESAVAGPPFARYDFSEDGFLVTAGFPVAATVQPSGPIGIDVLPGGQVATTTHIGPYEAVAGAYSAVEAWMAAHEWVPAGAPWESYLDGPEVAAPRTVVVWPCRRL